MFLFKTAAVIFNPFLELQRSCPRPENTELHQNKMDAMQRTALSIPLCGPLECVGHEFSAPAVWLNGQIDFWLRELLHPPVLLPLSLSHTHTHTLYTHPCMRTETFCLVLAYFNWASCMHRLICVCCTSACVSVSCIFESETISLKTISKKTVLIFNSLWLALLFLLCLSALFCRLKSKRWASRFLFILANIVFSQLDVSFNNQSN